MLVCEHCGRELEHLQGELDRLSGYIAGLKRELRDSRIFIHAAVHAAGGYLAVPKRLLVDPPPVMSWQPHDRDEICLRTTLVQASGEQLEQAYQHAVSEQPDPP